MTSLLLLAAACQSGLSCGPGLRLSALEGVRPWSVEAAGPGEARYEYRVSAGVSQFADALRIEPHIESARMWPASSSFKLVRRCGGVVQEVLVRQPVLGAVDRRTVVVVRESLAGP
jgi:hypothetical protein